MVAAALRSGTRVGADTFAPHCEIVPQQETAPARDRAQPPAPAIASSAMSESGVTPGADRDTVEGLARPLPAPSPHATTPPVARIANMRSSPPASATTGATSHTPGVAPRPHVSLSEH